MKINEQLMIFGDEPLLLPQMAGLWQACGGDTLHDTDRDSGLVSRSHVRFRVNLHKVLGHMAAVLRRIRTDIPGAELPGRAGLAAAALGSKQNGMILVTGSTGQGKSTTLAALLQWMNENIARHVVTIEDPVEYIFTNNHSSSPSVKSDATRPTLPAACAAPCARPRM